MLSVIVTHPRSPILLTSPAWTQPQDGRISDSDGHEGSEQRLILAIQEAQRARSYGLSAASSGANHSGGGRGVSYGNLSGTRSVNTWRLENSPPVRADHESLFTTAAVVVVVWHMTWVALEAWMDALLPLWMLLPGETGVGTLFWAVIHQEGWVLEASPRFGGHGESQGAMLCCKSCAGALSSVN